MPMSDRPKIVTLLLQSVTRLPPCQVIFLYTFNFVNHKSPHGNIFWESCFIPLSQNCQGVTPPPFGYPLSSHPMPRIWWPSVEYQQPHSNNHPSLADQCILIYTNKQERGVSRFARTKNTITTWPYRPQDTSRINPNKQPYTITPSNIPTSLTLS